MRRLNHKIFIYCIVTTIILSGCSLEKGNPESLSTQLPGLVNHEEQDGPLPVPGVRLDELAKLESEDLADASLPVAQKLKRGHVAYEAMPAISVSVMPR